MTLIMLEHSINDENLGTRWDSLDWDAIDESIARMQKEISIASDQGDKKSLDELTERFLTSFEARAKAVQNVTRNESTDNPGMGEPWTTSADRYKAALILDHHGYRSEPFYSFSMFEEKTRKNRVMCIPTFYDRAMHDLFRMLMEPLTEPMHDTRLFSSRRGRSLPDAACEVARLFDGRGSPEWVVRCDIRSFYDTMPHGWLLDNMPMDRDILEQFLKAPRYDQGKGEPTIPEKGVPTGNRLSPVMANLILDGLEEHLRDPNDPENGIAVRWVDDIVITARTKGQADVLLKMVEDFVEERDMELNMSKSYVKNVREGFEFLKYRFVKTGDRIEFAPLGGVTDKLLDEIRDAVSGKNTEKDVILAANNRLRGFAIKYRIADMEECAPIIDERTTGIVLSRLAEMHRISMEEATRRYIRDEGGYLTASDGHRLRKASDVPRVPHERLWLSANPFIHPDYFADRVERERVSKVSGDTHRAIWRSTKGRCAICGLAIRYDEPRTVETDGTRNAYVHISCSDESATLHGRISFLDVFVDPDTPCRIPESVPPIEVFAVQPNEGRTIIEKKQGRTSKYQPLIDIIERADRPYLDYTFSQLDGILIGGLCGGAYTEVSWWSRKGRSSIGEALECLDWEVYSVDMTSQHVRLGRRTVRFTPPEEQYRSRHVGKDTGIGIAERDERMRTAKFGKVTAFLLDCGLDQIRLRFDRIESIAGFQLPAFSRDKRWWSSRKPNSILSAVEDADFTKVQLDMEGCSMLLTRTCCVPDLERDSVVLGDLPIKPHMKRWALTISTGYGSWKTIVRAYRDDAQRGRCELQDRCTFRTSDTKTDCTRWIRRSIQ